MSQPRRPKRRSDAEPQIVSDQRRQQLGSSFAEQSIGEAADYDAVRPGYPDAALADIRCLAPESPQIVELGAGTGILTRQLLAAGAHVVAVEPSPEMLNLLLRTSPHTTLEGRCATAEDTGLDSGCADIVVAATAWHWFDPESVQAEILRILRPHGVLAVLSNHLDNTQDWVLRMARIMRAGDNYRPDWKLRLGPGFTAAQTTEYRWTRLMTPEELMRLSTTLSSWLAAKDPDRQRRRENLRWYLYEHLGHQPGDKVQVPYITSLHTARVSP